jgi:hypothetical protein
MQKLVEHNPHTGSKLQSHLPNKAYRNNFDSIFRKPKEDTVAPERDEGYDAYDCYKLNENGNWQVK